MFFIRPLLSTAALLILVGSALAGPLNPPAGLVASTMKTLTEVEPRIAINATNTPGTATCLFRITQPGSYYLTGNITGVVGKHGIEITASGVMLDLNGFDLAGVPGMGLVDGVRATSFAPTSIAVVNGSIRNWGDEGVDLATDAATNCRVEGLLVSGNAGNGIDVGPGSTISKCSAYGNAGSGISTNNCCTVANCSAYGNAGTGISAGLGSKVSSCSANNNTGNGIDVFDGGTVEGCTARINTLDGIRCSSSCVIRGNNCASNGAGDGAGIHSTGSNNRIEGNNCTTADRGIDVDAAGNIIMKNACSDNAINWTIAAGNAYGPIVATPAGVAVNGNTAAAALGSTDPNANFSY